jgi:flagellar secretion chaperone FliS
MSDDPTLSYQHASACGASPIGQIVALYDTILRDFGRALAALQAGNVEARVFELNHAIAVIGYLQYVLDHERGGEPARQFAQFYNMTRAMIVQANGKATPETIEELIELYRGLRQAWYQAEMQARTGPAQTTAAERPGEAATAGDPSPANDDGGIPQLQWSA